MIPIPPLTLMFYELTNQPMNQPSQPKQQFIHFFFAIWKYSSVSSSNPLFRNMKINFHFSLQPTEQHLLLLLLHKEEKSKLNEI